jgi:hypothetical protein
MKLNKKAQLTDEVIKTIIWIGILAAAVVAITFIIAGVFK